MLRRFAESLMLAFIARRSIMFMCVLIVGLASASTLQGQRIAPVGARPSATAAGKSSDTKGESVTFGDATLEAAGTRHSKQFHVVTGLLGGTAIGVVVGAVVANQEAKRCHAESCQVQAALGGL